MVICNLWCFSLFAICLQSYVILIHPEKRALPSTPSCTQCIKSTKQGNTIISTLLYHTMKPDCNATYIGPCVQNNTQYFRCYTKQGIECYDPKAIGPITANIYIYTYKGDTGTSVEQQFQLAQQRQGYLTHNETRDGNKVSACFDVCLAISKTAPSDHVSCGDLAWQRSYLQNNKYLYTPRKALFTGHASIQSGYDYWYTTEANKIPGPFGFNITKGIARTDCSMDKCNPICISYEVPQKETFYAKLGVGIDGSGSDPYGHVIIKTDAKPTPGTNSA